MKKIMNKDNKGFSLIELIIVIAIMAVLIAIIAPNLTKYLGSSKQQTDSKNLDETVTQVKNCIADAAVEGITISTSAAGTTDTITLTITDGTCTGGPADFNKLVSKALKDGKTASKVDPSKKTIQVTLSGNDIDGYDVTAAFN